MKGCAFDEHLWDTRQNNSRGKGKSRLKHDAPKTAPGYLWFGAYNGYLSCEYLAQTVDKVLSQKGTLQPEHFVWCLKNQPSNITVKTRKRIINTVCRIGGPVEESSSFPSSVL